MLLAFCSTTILKQKYINIFGYTFFIVASGSMSGTLDINDMVIIKITDDIKVNDIVTYMKDDYFITHRVIDIDDKNAITKGDVNNTEDEPIEKKDIIGKVTFVFPFSAIFQIFGSLILIIIVIVVFNFDKLLKKYIFNKKIISEELNLINDYDLIEQVEQQLYDKSVLKNAFIELIKKRNNYEEIEIDEYWLFRLKVIVNLNKSFENNDYRSLIVLINKYKVNCEKRFEEVFDEKVVKSLENEPVKSDFILLLNCILYGDYELFELLYSFFRKKINYLYIDKF